MIKPDSKKPSKQSISHLKDTQSIPLSKVQPSKGSQAGTEYSNSVKNYYGPIEGDFSKIGCTYILQNDRLRKKTPLYGLQKVQQNHNQISTDSPLEIEDVQIIKQIAKLEYLEKRGFLKTQEVQKLNKLRGEPQIQNLIKNQQSRQELQSTSSPNKKVLPFSSNDFDSENIDPNLYYQDCLSPKKHHTSMKPHLHQNHSQHHTYQPYQYQTPQRLYQGKIGYENQFTVQGYLQHPNYY